MSTHAEPTDGWPANGSSTSGVKIRSRYSGAATSIGNAVSDRLNSFAIACSAAVSSPSAPSTTASGLPANAASVKTSTTSYSRCSGGTGYGIVMPPSTGSVMPVTYDAASLARKTPTLASSAGSPRRPAGVIALTNSASESSISSVISVGK